MATSTTPTTGVDGYTPAQFTSSGQVAAVNGDTLVIAAAAKSETKDITPITSLVTYDMSKIAQKDLQLTGDLAKTYQGGLKVVGSNANETLIFGATADVNGSKVKTKISDTTINLNGGGTDNLLIQGKTSVKKTTVVIDSKDTITNKKGQTFTAADVNDKGKIKGLGGITFNVVG